MGQTVESRNFHVALFQFRGEKLLDLAGGRCFIGARFGLGLALGAETAEANGEGASSLCDFPEFFRTAADEFKAADMRGWAQCCFGGLRNWGRRSGGRRRRLEFLLALQLWFGFGQS